MATHRDLARALFLKEIGALKRVRLVKPNPSAVDCESFFLLSLIGARVGVETEIHTVRVLDGAPVAVVPVSRTATAVL